MHCELCGKEDNLVRAIIEKTQLKVCKNCASYGKVIAEPKAQKTRAETAQTSEIVEKVIDNVGVLIKQKRESMNLPQKEFANKLSERESLISKIETGQTIPSLKLAKKLQYFLGITLIEKYEEGDVPILKQNSSSEGFTLGDFI